MSNFKWMPLVGMNLSAANLAAAEKLRKFGFAVNCGEFGSEKYTKAALCIFDVLAQKENPNILVVTQSGEMYSWYKSLVTSIGADFKIVNGSANSLLFFNEHGASMYIISQDALFGENVLKKKVSKRFLWDLIIIDEELNTDVPDYAKYESAIIWNSEKLLINAPFPAKNDEDKAALASLVKSVLDKGELSERANSLDFGAECAKLDENNPVMRYFSAPVYTDGAPREVVFAEYEFDEKILANLRRRVDLRSGLPAYRYGGNVFEAFDCDKFEKEKKIYSKAFFTRSDVEDLRAFDKKLDCLLKLCEETLGDSSGRMMIYCCEKSTSEYLHKALSCLYGAEVHFARGGLFRNEDITSMLTPQDASDQPKILIGQDDLGTVGEGFENITCVVNYELPLSPVLLERRMTRHGAEKEARRKFVIFRDKNGVFDSCILDKTLFLQLDSAFCGNLPARNILLDIKEKGRSVNALVADLKYLRDFAKQVDNCLDLIKKVKCEYAVPETEKLGSGKQLAEFAQGQLEKIFKLLGVSESSSEGDITNAVNAVGGLCTVSGGKLEKAARREEMAASFSSDTFSNEPFAGEAIPGLASAKTEIDELHKGDNFHLRIKQEISSLNDCLQYPALYGIWKYRAKEQDSDRSFKDYIKIYNDGF